ncbi:uncharacterized protein LOC124927080 isoform X2 [Impatiens glandulifera]|uniref:uncharacterized protein LOC124927080 isoform X2 n=1 Tax=Impatiens glandulifera TaxID=253017 RepID=UPI001FB0BB01|nr:uncharacterized protein LOC124927080 isoform X2 [Impatiens glandulifera]
MDAAATSFDKNLELIDISSEDDFLIASDPFRHSLDDDFRFSVGLGNIDEEEIIEFSRAMNNNTEGRKKDVYSSSINTGRIRNSRKSLAWDSAFFTSPGVLDPYELSIINKGFKEVEDRVSCDDDLDASLEDIDGFSVGSSECELFEDVRASVHRSFTSSCWKSVTKEAIKHNAQCSRSSTKEPALKKVDAVYQQHGTLSKPTNRRGNVYIKGSKSSTEYAKTPQNAKTVLDSHKLPKVVKGWNNPVSSASTKRSSSKQLVNLPSKIAKCVVPGTPRTPILPKPVSNKVNSRYDLSYSVSSSASISSQSSLKKSRGKVHSNTKSLSVTELPCKTPTRNKLMNSYHYSPFESAVSSSIDGFSSVRSSSSSSWSSTNRPSKGLNSLVDTTPPIFSYDFHSSQWVLSPTQLTHESKSSSSTESRRSCKPSGLRMPSPTVGFFDEENSSIQFSFGAQCPLIVSEPEKTPLHNPDTEICRRSTKKNDLVKVLPSKSRNLNNNNNNNGLIERRRSGAKPGNVLKTSLRLSKNADLSNKKAGNKTLQLGDKENLNVNVLSRQFGGLLVSAS